MRDGIALFLFSVAALAVPQRGEAAPTDFNFTVNVGTNLPDNNLANNACADVNGQCSLRAALEQINFFTDGPITLHRITFSVATVTLNGAGLPPVNFPTVIDGAFGAPRVRINGNGTSCFNLNSPESGGAVPGFLGFPNFNNSRLENLVVNNCSGNGVSISGHGYVVSNSYIGTDVAGEAAAANGGAGISITSPAGENSIPPGLINALLPPEFSDVGSIITYIIATLPNIAPNGIVDNVISGNTGNGVDISGQFSSGTILFNNRIGTDDDGQSKIPNGTAGGDHYGIRISGNAYANIVGLDNVVGGHDASSVDGGILITGAVPFPNIIAGNQVGTSVPLFPDLGNSQFGIRTSGVRPTNAADVALDPNTIANPLGISAVIGPGNIVGYNGNLAAGSINPADTSFGEAGISVFNSADDGVIVTGNIVGISDGIVNAIDIGNQGDGINVVGTNHVIGGDTLIQGNIIGSNDRHGLVLRGGTNAGGTVSRANAIGTLPDFLVDAPLLGNAGHGIWVQAGGQEIGGPDFMTMRNVIANNGLDGIDFVDQNAHYGMHINRNSIYSVAPGHLGIDLKGVTTDNLPDLTDNVAFADRSTFSFAYTNWQQNTVTMSNPGNTGGVTTASWELRSHLDGQYTLQFFSNSESERGGRQFLCEITGVVTSTVDPDDAEGGIATGAMCAGGNLAGQFVTATVTDTAPTVAGEPDRPGSGGMDVPILNTSEFSAPLAIPDEVRFTLATQPAAAESAGSVMVAVERVGNGTGAVTADVVVSGGTATAGAGNDYVLGAAQVSWNTGQTGVRNVMVTINDDALDENAETVLFELQNASGAIEGTPNSTSLTIDDNDDPPTISISDPMITETEATQPLGFTVTLSAASSFPVDVTYSTSNATAMSGSDYSAASGLMVTIAAGQIQASFDIDVLGDLLDEADVETFNVSYTATNTTAAGSDLQGTGTINDDDPLPVVSIDDVGPLPEGDAGNTPFGFTLSLDTLSARPVTVRVSTGNGADTAVVATDYAMLDQLFVIPAGTLSVPVTVNVVGDVVFEPLPVETFTVNLAADAVQPLNAMIVDPSGLGTITNDDAAPIADLSLAKSHVGNFSQGQVGASYTLVVSNSAAGDTDASAVTVSDVLPAGMTATGLSGTGWVCVLGTLSCSRNDVLLAGQSYPAITLVVDVAGNASTPLVNQATVSGGGDVTPGNNTAMDSTTVTPVVAPDLSLAKTHAGNFTQGQAGASYTLTVNNSAAAATNGTQVSVTDTLPAGMTATALSGAGWACVLGTLTCTRADVLPASGSYPAITLTLDVAPNATTPLVNQATLSGGGDATPANNTALDPTTIDGAPATPDLSLAKMHAGDFAQGQVGASYTLTVSNSPTAPTNGTQVSVTDALPAGMTATAMTGAGWSCVLGTLTCTRSDVLAVSSSYPDITLTVDVAGNAATPLVNQATVSGGGDASPGNNTALDPTNVMPLAIAPDLSLAKNHAGNFTQGQVGASYALTVSNSAAAPSDGTQVSVTDTLPAGMTATAMAGAGWSCVLGTLTCTRSDVLAVSSSYPTITLTVDVAGNATTPLVNAATLSGGGDASPVNNTAMDSTAIDGAPATPDLSLVKTHVGNFSQGQAGASYTLTVSSSASAATDGTQVSVTDTLPAGMTATAMTGAGWSCVLGTLTCTRSDVLAVSSSYPAITLTVDVAGNATTPLVNQATVSGGGDASPGNNTAMDPTTVTPVAVAPDLSLAKTHVGNFSQGQAGASYTLGVSNSAAAATDGTQVSVTDTLPPGMTATAMTGAGWTCMLGTLTCTRSDVLAAGGNYPAITLTVTVAANAGTPLVNQATLSGGGDVTPANNTAMDPTTVTPVVLPDLALAKTHVGNFTQGQVGASYTLTVGNSAAAATNGTQVSVADTLPAGMTATAMTGAGWTCVLGTLTCTRSDVLAASGSYPPITLTVTVAGNATTPLVNAATVSGGGDASPGNNTAMDATTIDGAPPSPDLSLAKTHVGNFSQGQAGASYTLSVSNSAAAATNGTQVSVTDTLPAGMTATAITGTGWTCVLGTLTCTRSDVLAASGSYPAITLTVTVAGNAATPLVNQATVSGGGDASPGNNTAMDATVVTPVAADLTLVKTHAGNFTQGQAGAFSLTVSNTSGAPTNGTLVSVVDTLPAGLAATSLAGTGWSCVLATVSCSRSDVLAAGASYPPITLTVNVAADATSPQVNNAAVSGGGDTTPASNAASDPAIVLPAGAQGVFAPRIVPATSPLAMALMLLSLLALGAFGLRRLPQR